MRAEKLEEFNSFLERWKKLVKEKPELFEEIKSWNSYGVILGKTHSGMNLWEYDSISDFEKSN